MRSKVLVAYGQDRRTGTRRAVEAFGMPDLAGKTVMVKPNFNTADPAPGSTHKDTLESMIMLLQQRGAKHIIVGDRSGPADSREVFERKGIFEMADRLGFECVIFNMPESGFVKMSPAGSHWRDGFLFRQAGVGG
jgi:uncharacterized protein (DUF362 family)